VQLVLDFAPDAWTPNHTHGGQVYVTVLSGEITTREDGEETKYGVGDHWQELPGDYHVAGNATGETARVVAAFLLPKGSPLTTVEDTTPTDQLPPGPTLVYQTRTDGAALSGPIKVTQLLGEWDPGEWTPTHSHGGVGTVTVLDGTITVREAGAEHSYGPGESWVEGGTAASVGNSSDAKASVVASFVYDDSAALTTVHDDSVQIPARLPATGAADTLWVLMALGLGCVAAGAYLRRRTAVA
jgi:LPXTG-motif cell wall-anchored protein